MQKSRWILQTLILSVALNTILLSIFFYFLVHDHPLHFAYRPKVEIIEKEPPLTSTLLERLQSLTFPQLVELITDVRRVEYGYRVGDFALGALAAFHDFDVERGLGKGSLSIRHWKFSGKSFLLYPGLKEEDLERLQHFATQDRWPLTPKGLFYAVQQTGMEECDPELIAYFCRTPHFVLIETLFARTRLPLQKKNLLSLVLESSWERLENFYQNQKVESDFSAETRQELLIGSVAEGSKTAAYLMILTDISFALKQLDDRQLLQILDLLDVKTTEAMQFVQLTASSPRSDAVHERAMERLVFYTGSLPQDLAGHFHEKPGLKQLRPVFREQPPAAPDPRTHVIQPGESLWLISKKYQVPMEKLMEWNHLQTDVIQPGKSLKIP